VGGNLGEEEEILQGNVGDSKHIKEVLWVLPKPPPPPKRKRFSLFGKKGAEKDPFGDANPILLGGGARQMLGVKKKLQNK